ncbi:cAMP-dependent protein kinase inhibitor beta-like isoform X2 [Melanaphis sacchari]|uniref:cAMP-dependent protein kinase inhibitor beta-like isoform X2 n=1 Tax=Melanaphis sacchari TaxID=742174 RepID=UPI000DC155DC|nr:cAMP-dependent protein kinase inhibitor beta-like isoform X2 [Melanaphis sacchari]
MYLINQWFKLCVALRMVAAEMTSNQDKDVTQVQYIDISPDFLTTGRTGRRNALPDILGEHKLTSTADLPDRLQALTTNEGTETSNMQPSTSSDSDMIKTQNATC